LYIHRGRSNEKVVWAINLLYSIKLLGKSPLLYYKNAEKAIGED
jgi:hypothetical protein